MNQVNFVVECVMNQASNLFVVRGSNGQIVHYTNDVRLLADFFDKICNKNHESEGK